MDCIIKLRQQLVNIILSIVSIQFLLDAKQIFFCVTVLSWLQKFAYKLKLSKSSL